MSDTKNQVVRKLKIENWIELGPSFVFAACILTIGIKILRLQVLEYQGGVVVCQHSALKEQNSSLRVSTYKACIKELEN